MIVSPWLIIVITCLSGACFGLGLAMLIFDFYHNSRNR
jgi:RsiW-degrading membrane proteinase PrsW (M82 family)